MSGQPTEADVDALRDLLDLMAEFPSNDQRARYLLSSNWMRDRDARAAGARDALARVEALLPTTRDPGPLRCGDNHGLSTESVRLLRAALAADTATDTGQETA